MKPIFDANFFSLSKTDLEFVSLKNVAKQKVHKKIVIDRD